MLDSVTGKVGKGWRSFILWLSILFARLYVVFVIVAVASFATTIVLGFWGLALQGRLADH